LIGGILKFSLLMFSSSNKKKIGEGKRGNRKLVSFDDEPW
jgi:hypothetical protein